MYRSETAPWRPNSEICLIREESIKKKKKKKKKKTEREWCIKQVSGRGS